MQLRTQGGSLRRLSVKTGCEADDAALYFGDGGSERYKESLMEIRDRLRDLNTKAYYLLVALSFVYRTNPTASLKCAFTLTALVAVLPLQDYIESPRKLEGIRIFKVVCLVAALAFTLWWLWCSKVAA